MQCYGKVETNTWKCYLVKWQFCCVVIWKCIRWWWCPKSTGQLKMLFEQVTSPTYISRNYIKSDYRLLKTLVISSFERYCLLNGLSLKIPCYENYHREHQRRFCSFVGKVIFSSKTNILSIFLHFLLLSQKCQYLWNTCSLKNDIFLMQQNTHQDN